MTVRDLVWEWLESGGRRSLLFSDLTKGLCGRGRVINRLSSSPRDAIRQALHELQAEGVVSLTPANVGRYGRPGLRIEVIGLDPTHEERNL
jgi:hypothetical protein